mmetsp:Transcript_20378/g.33975  ORF Transcript_20378/g.33975 Transcript_20378/m.33975 type:complete len:239 (-) Transcript_20378:228-944(-)
MTTIVQFFPCRRLQPLEEPKQYDFKVRTKGAYTKVYRGRIGPPATYAPMGLFHPRLLEPDPNQSFHFQYIEHEDVFEDIFAAEAASTQRQSSSKQWDLFSSGLETSPRSTPFEGANGPADSRSIVPLDEAIATSICRVGRSELRKKLFTSVVLVGGTTLFPGFLEMLEERLVQRIPEDEDIDTVNVLSSVRELDFRSAAWRGAAVLCTLDVCKDQWIPGIDWKLFGPRIIREHVMFSF